MEKVCLGVLWEIYLLRDKFSETRVEMNNFEYALKQSYFKAICELNLANLDLEYFESTPEDIRNITEYSKNFSELLRQEKLLAIARRQLDIKKIEMDLEQFKTEEGRKKAEFEIRQKIKEANKKISSDVIEISCPPPKS